MNNLDKQYTALLQDILDNGVEKKDRTGTGTISVFGRQIRHKMSEGFPLLTTKKMYMKGIITELLWFLRGDTNIKYLVDNDCHIWDGDAYKNYEKFCIDVKWMEPVKKELNGEVYEMGRKYDKEGFINRIKTDDEFAKKWGSLGKIYGYQWRNWNGEIDQISELIRQLKEEPDSRRLVVNAWAVHDLPNMVLPPCHYGFQVYTRELSVSERLDLAAKTYSVFDPFDFGHPAKIDHDEIDEMYPVPKRAISLMWNQRSVDTFLGLPFNIASYGLLLEIIAKAVNMVPDELIGNLGDVHLYSNHIEQAKEQIGRELTFEERVDWWFHNMKPNRDVVDEFDRMTQFQKAKYLEGSKVPYSTREPYALPKLNINTEWWPYEGGECGEGPLDAIAIFESFKGENFCKCLLEEDIQLGSYQSHPTIKAPLSN